VAVYVAAEARSITVSEEDGVVADVDVSTEVRTLAINHQCAPTVQDRLSNAVVDS